MDEHREQLGKLLAVMMENLEDAECQTFEEFESNMKNTDGGMFVAMAAVAYREGMLVQYFARYFDMLPADAKLRVSHFFAEKYLLTH